MLFIHLKIRKGGAMKDVICFEVNDWHRDWPAFFDEWFDFGSDKHEGKNWMKDLDAYAKENRLCIKVVCVDMAVSLVVTAPVDWVEKNLPEFRDQRWRDYCEYKYPSPFFNDQVKWQPRGIEYEENEDYEKRRRSLLSTLHLQFSEEELENFKPHNLVGSPSGELFLDWSKENFGAKEWENGHIYGEDDGT